MNCPPESGEKKKIPLIPQNFFYCPFLGTVHYKIGDFSILQEQKSGFVFLH